MKRISTSLWLLLLGLVSSCAVPMQSATTIPSTATQESVEKTPTGFYWPTGTSKIGDYADWLSDGCAWSGNGNYFKNEFHIGKDIAANEGAQVYAIADGEVLHRSPNGWGTDNIALLIVHKLSDGSSFTAVYGHIRSSLIKGDPVDGGKPFATVGPWDNGAHLHFGIRAGTSTKDPYGRMPCPPQAPITDANGFDDPIKWITTKSPFGQAAAITPITALTRTPPAPVPTPTRALSKTVTPTFTPTPTPQPTPTGVAGITGLWEGVIKTSGESGDSEDLVAIEIIPACSSRRTCFRYSHNPQFEIPLVECTSLSPIWIRVLPNAFCFSDGQFGIYVFALLPDGTLSFSGESPPFVFEGMLARKSDVISMTPPAPSTSTTESGIPINAHTLDIAKLISPAALVNVGYANLDGSGPEEIIVSGLGPSRIFVDIFAYLREENNWVRVLHFEDKNACGLGFGMLNLKKDASRQVVVYQACGTGSFVHLEIYEYQGARSADLLYKLPEPISRGVVQIVSEELIVSSLGQVYRFVWDGSTIVIK